jgi:signal transduction histidine kinase
MALMEKYNISPTSSHQMFVSAVHRYLIWASLAALLLAVVLSFLLMRKVLRPLGQMTTIAQKISTGDYSGQVPFVSKDEVGQLAASFNRMAESLRRIEGLRKTLMIDVAHELRTPLTNIRGYLEALTDGCGSTKETLNCSTETMRLIHLLEDVLAGQGRCCPNGPPQRDPDEGSYISGG